jgi:hypothetical protein
MAKNPTPKDLFGAKDKGKTLGREARSGVETQIGKIASGLNFDADKEREARSAKIEDDRVKALSSVSRSFALKSGGVKQGRALSRASAIEGGALTARAGLEGEISQRQGQEQRANLQALQGVQKQLDEGDITAVQLGQAGRGLDIQQQQVGGQLELGKGQLDLATATQSDDVELRTLALDLQDKIASGQLSLGAAQLKLDSYVGRAGVELGKGQLTLAEATQSDDADIRNRALNIDDRIRGGQLTVSEGQLELNEYIGERQLDQSQQQLNLAARNFGLDEKKFTESIRQFNSSEGEQRTQFYFKMQEDAKALKEKLTVEREGLAVRVRAGDQQAAVQKAQLDQQISNQDGILALSRDQFEESAEQFKNQQILERERLTEQRHKRFDETGFRSAQLQQSTVEHEDNLQQRKTEFSRQFGLTEQQFNEAVRRVSEDETFRNTEFGQRVQEYEESQTRLDSEFTHQTTVELRRLDQVDSQNTEATRTFDATLLSRENELLEKHGISREQLQEAREQRKLGKMIHDGKMANIYREFTTTHNEAVRQFDKDLEFNKGRATMQDEFTKAGLVGEVDGEATMARISLLHDQKMTEAQIFGDPMPIVMGGQELVAMATAIQKGGGSISSDSPQFIASMDTDGNGTVTLAEYKDIANTQEPLGGGIVQMQPRGRATLARDALGLDRDKFTAGMAMSKDQLRANKEQWTSMFEGKRMGIDDNGNSFVEKVWDDTTKPPDWRESVNADQERHNAQLAQMERRTNTTATDMAKRIGLVPENDLVAIDSFFAEVGTDGIIGGTHVASFLMSAVGDKLTKEEQANMQLTIDAPTPQVRRGRGEVAGLPTGKMPVSGFSEVSKETLRKALGLYAEAQETTPADIARQFLISALPDEQKIAFGNTVSQAVFGSSFTPTPKAPSGLAGVLGTVAGVAGAFL